MSIWKKTAYTFAALIVTAAVLGKAEAQGTQPAAPGGEVQVATQTDQAAPAQESRTETKTAPEWEDNVNDPLQIVISLPEQKLTLYRGLTPVTTSRVSTGQAGYNTPSGVFSILRKEVFHRSNIYSGAPMPFMQRLTWSGISLHASNAVPNYPASHGCIRMPGVNAQELYGITQMGIHVIVASEPVVPAAFSDEKLFHPAAHEAKRMAETETVSDAENASPAKAEAKRSTSPLRILVTRMTGRQQLMEVQELLKKLQFDPGDIDGFMGPDTAKAVTRFQKTYRLPADGLVSDEFIAKLYQKAGKGKPANGRLYVRQDFNPVFDAPVSISGGEQPLGSHLFTAMYFDEDATQTRWTTITLTKGSPLNRYNRWANRVFKPAKDEEADALPPSTAAEALDRITIPDETRKRIDEMLTPGSSLAITNDGVSYETMPKGTDFVVLMQ